MFPLNASPSSSEYRPTSPVSNSNVYIAKLPVHVDEATLTKLFEQYGTIECCRVQRNPQNTTGRTFGFVKFRSRQEARGAIEGMNGALINGTPIEVKLADQDPGEKASSGTPSDNLYVRNLPSTWGTEEMTALFSHYGSVMTCRVLHSGEGTRGAGGLVRMSTVSEASQAIAGLNGRIPQGGSDMLFVRYADTPEEKARRKAKKNGHHSQPHHPHHHPYARYVSYTTPPPQGLQIAQQQPVYAVESGGPYPGTGWTLDPAAAAAAYSVTPAPATYTSVYTPRPGNYSSPPPQPCSIYIKNLPPTADKLFLYEKFARFGAITSVKPMPDEATGACKGIGFVNYTDASAARMAVDHMNGALLGDKVLHVSLQSIKLGG